jgi:selenocysteine lyase/cysteine desulfurase
MEHNSVWRPLTALQERGVELSIAEADEHGVVNPESVKRLLRHNTRLIAIIHASNMNGAIQPVAEIGEFARKWGVTMLADAAQSAGSLPISVEAMCVDLLAFPGHKGLLGPQGTGGLYVREGVVLKPLKQGGTGSESNSPHQPSYYPDCMESGTLNAPGIAGLSAAVRYLLKTGVEQIAGREAELTRCLLAGLGSIEGVTVYGPALGSPRAPVVSFNLRGRDPIWIANELERRADIACRSGWHCAGLAHRTQGTAKMGTVRLSPGPFTTMSEVETALEVIEKIAGGN